MTRKRVIVVGVGQALAGDDGVGPAVVRELGTRGVPPDVELVERTEPFDLVSLLLQGGREVVVVDAALSDGPPGEVVLLTPAEVSKRSALLSGHALGLAEAVELAGVLSMEDRIAPITIVAIRIPRTREMADALSPAVSEAVPVAASVIERLVQRALLRLFALRDVDLEHRP